MYIDLLNINLNDFHFLRPLFLWLLVPAIISLVLGLINIQKQARWQKHIAPHLRPFVIKTGSEMKLKLIRVITILIFSIAILGLAGPTWEKIEIPGQILETPVVIVLDMSQSMMATDLQPNRLERAKFKIHDFLKANPHARTALIGYAGTAHTIVPLTTDYNIILNHLDGLRPDILPVQGSNLEAALELCDTITSISEAPAHIILFSDDFDETSFSALQNFVSTGNKKLEIMPMNTSSGADIYKSGSNVPFKDKNGEIVHSALNQNILNKLNSIDNINVNALTLDKSDVELLAKNIGSNLKFQEEDKEKDDDWEDRGLLLAIPLALLALIWFRKGWVVFSFLVLVGFTSCQSDGSFKDLWLTKDFQAQKAYDNGNFAQSAELFSDPLHKGVAWYKAGDFDKAIEEFKNDTSSIGAYNLGLALYQNGNYTQAAVAFEKALELNPNMEQARQNKLLMLELDETTVGEGMQDPMEASEKETAENIENKDMEDLGGGGQEATEEDMKKERKEENVATEMRKGKELEEVPDDFKSGNEKKPQNIIMQKVDDDPSLFLKRKFTYQLKKGFVSKPVKNTEEW
jgi:Ca-activated chloride channel family protein